jgi:hypothetical protein
MNDGDVTVTINMQQLLPSRTKNRTHIMYPIKATVTVLSSTSLASQYITIHNIDL